MPGREHTSVIVVSAAGEPGDVLRCAELGALDHLSKPFGYDEMKRSIMSVLDATPKRRIEMQESRTAQAETYQAVIDLVDEANEPSRRGLFSRARSSHR